MKCRVGCAACCIAPSISSSIPGMAAGKPAGVRCPRLTDDNRCLLFDNNERPQVCRNLQPSEEMCGASSAEAMERLTEWEQLTRPETTSSGPPDSTP
ncbi:MAG: YkgJ family cysteine cluster protein [Desulfuromonadaceae bacterium]